MKFLKPFLVGTFLLGCVSLTLTGCGGGGGGNCLIASLTHGTPLHKELDTIRTFRDRALLTNPVGSAFAKLYYEVSAAVGRWMSAREKSR